MNQAGERYDAAVIGGGPAGSSAAIALARAGRRVIVFEKDVFPRFHIGESLLPYNLPLLRELGVYEKIAAAGFMEKHGARFRTGDGSAGTAVRFGEGMFTAEPMAYQVDRARFDEILLRHAEECGAVVREGSPVRDYEVQSDCVRVSTADADVEAKFLIDASGQCSVTGVRERQREFLPGLRKVAAFAHFEGAKLPDDPCRGDIVIIKHEGGWLWIIPLSEARVSVGLVTDAEALRGEPSLQEIFERAARQSPAAAEFLADAARCGPVRTASDFSYINRRLVGPRLVRVGDAAGFLDPIFSSGVYLAMLSGRDAAAAVDEALARGAPMTRGLRRYERQMRRRMNVFHRMIDGFYRPPFIELMLHPHERFRLSSAVNAVLAGRLDACWKVRWRLAAFLALVRIQARIPLVPRVRLPPL